MNKNEKSNRQFIWFLITITLATAILLIGKAVYGQTQNNYGIANFSRRDAYPKDGLVFDANFLTAQPEGDITQGQGDMETWVAGCPSGFLCVNLGAGSFAQETAKLYKNNSSGKLTVDGAGSTTSYTYPMSYEANAYYQISFRYKGEAGAETIDCGAHNLALSEFYDFTVHTWGAPSIVFLTATTSWKTANLYMDVGAVAKPSYYFSIGRASGINPSQVFYIDDLQIRKLKKGGPYSGPSNVTMTVNGDPSFDSQNAKNSFKGQPGNWGTSFNGTTDYLSYPDTGDTFDPCSTGKECKLTVAYSGILNNINNTQAIVNKYSTAADLLSWTLYVTGGDYEVDISNDGTYNGGHFSYRSYPASAIGSLDNLIFRYYGIAQNTSILGLQKNNNSETSTSTAVFPLYNTSAGFTVGARADATAKLSSSNYRVSVYNKYFDSIDASKWINPYFPANNNNRGFYVSTCTQAASHATCSWDTCRDGTPHACQAEETGSMAIFDTKTELVPYNSFETVTGDDSAPTFAGWTLSGASGTAYRNETKHGNVAVRFITTVAGQVRQATSSCIGVSPSTAYYGEFSGKKLSSDSNAYLIMYEYSDGACSTYVTSQLILPGTNLDGVFTQYGETKTTGVGTNSVTIAVQEYSGSIANQDILIDSVSLKAGSYRTPWVHNAGAGSTSYNARDYRLHNVLVDPTPQGTYPWSLGWCAGAWVWTDFDGAYTGGHYIFDARDAGVANTESIRLETGNNIVFALYDSASQVNYRYIASNATNWSANNWHYIEACSSNTGTMFAHWYNVANSTWYNMSTVLNNGTGIQTSNSSNIDIGNSHSFGNIYLDGYISNICFAPYSATFSNVCWNSGNPPKRPY